ncbi:hypothetical protein KC331_g389 [Hortaea werneckii]|nr:hypothetical protein KC361_g8662 [Hortaea werneckii]KAI6823141.1 hypothetical protein KC342_g12231 [Hortaea werneckii]KAI7554664.1 hypothetical protein KC331_g389 [Hortaea werneckii]KAI7722575.1 hypothetical protein KC353_g386 [Hortaea werneckii]
MLRPRSKMAALGISALALTSRAAPIFSPILPPSYPLAVKNPYLSAWLPGDQVADLAAATPQFWTGQGITWSILARVDGTLYSLFGDPPQSSGVKPAITNSADYTSTHTIFGLTAGDADLTLDFMTPVPPDELRSSESTDDSWISPPNTDTPTNWSYALSAADTHILTLAAQDQFEYSEIEDVAQWGTVAYCTRPYGSNVSARAGPMSDMHTEFGTTGSLKRDSEWGPGSVIALNHDLGHGSLRYFHIHHQDQSNISNPSIEVKMGTNPLLRHFETTITVNNDSLTEHEDPSPPAEPERTTTRHVEVTTNTTFTITLKAGKDLHFLGNGLAVNMYIDGLVDSLLPKREDIKTSVMGQTYSSEGLHSAVDEVQRFRFADLRTVVADDITVAEGGSPPLLRGFMEAVKGASFDYYSSSLIPDQPSPFVIYVFKYRSLRSEDPSHPTATCISRATGASRPR